MYKFKDEYKKEKGFECWSEHPDYGSFTDDYVNWLEQKIALNIADVMPSLLKEEQLEPIENALYATKHFTAEQCTNLAEGILTYIKDNNYDIVKINEA